MAKVVKERPKVTGKSLADIAEEKVTLEVWLLENEGELTPELEALLADHEADRAQKIERIGYVIEEEKSHVTALDEQIKRLQARKRAKENRIEWLKDGYLARLMQEMGMEPGDKVEGALVTVALQLNNPRLDMDANIPIESFDPAFVRYIPEQFEIDRVKLLAEAKANPSILPEGVRVVRDISVRVR